MPAPKIRLGLTPKSLLVVGLIFLACLVVIGLLAYGFAYRARQQMLLNQELRYTPPTTPTQHQVKRVLLKRLGPNGLEYLEILADGTVNLYDADMNLIKSGLQGFGRVNSLLDDIAKNMKLWQLNLRGRGNYTLIVETNMGTYTYTITGGGSGDSDLDDILDNLEDLGNDTFAPTPIPQPTTIVPTAPPGASPTPTTSYLPGITPTLPPNPLTPTPLPGYMTAPPFSCNDYYLNRPITISNILCLPNQP
ncbi:hypothetical protein A2W24_03355 [Microgenomates group bacterium RBG_16_45_19]|nr:MAG: hypothetical protein A2W24_03355 [Microgenomates group bacterium RBG_16_45_19]